MLNLASAKVEFHPKVTGDNGLFGTWKEKKERKNSYVGNRLEIEVSVQHFSHLN